MNWFHNLRIQPKLLLSFAIVAGLFGVALLFAYGALSTADSSMDEMYSNQMKVYAQLAELDGTVGNSTIAEQAAVLAGRPAEQAQFVGDSQKALDQAIAS